MIRSIDQQVSMVADGWKRMLTTLIVLLAHPGVNNYLLVPIFPREKKEYIHNGQNMGVRIIARTLIAGPE